MHSWKDAGGLEVLGTHLVAAVGSARPGQQEG